MDVLPPLSGLAPPIGDSCPSSYPAQYGGLQRSYSPRRSAQPCDGSYMPPNRDLPEGPQIKRTFSPAGRCRESSSRATASTLGGFYPSSVQCMREPSSAHEGYHSSSFIRESSPVRSGGNFAVPVAMSQAVPGMSQPPSPVRQRLRAAALPEYGGSSVRSLRPSEHASVILPTVGGIGHQASPYASCFNSVSVPVPMDNAAVGPSVAVGMLRTGSLGQGGGKLINSMQV